MKRLSVIIVVAVCFTLPASGGQPLQPAQCEIIPLPEDQVSFLIDGKQTLRWHFGRNYPRPFFFPFNGPSGISLTRMGHPGAPNHDHHRSIWFAHNSVNGLDFWSDLSETKIRQKTWYAYRDGAEDGIMACLLVWHDGDGKEVMEQDTIAAIIPMENGDYSLELQIALRPGLAQKSVELGKTNFGFLAVRVAKSLSAYFGGGKLTNSEGQEGEPDIFGKQARWMDYSGPIALGSGSNRRMVIEGITCFDHPTNPRYPTYWHVREDGWMGASFCLKNGFKITPEKHLVLRYLLHAHSSAYDHANAESIHNAFAARSGFRISKATEKHHQYRVERTY